MEEVQSPIPLPKKKTISLNVVDYRKFKMAAIAQRKSNKRPKSLKSQITMEALGYHPSVEFPPKEHVQTLRRAARWLVRPGSGILAADETMNQIDTKLQEMKLCASNLNRYRLHELFLGGNLELGDFLSGVLLREESISHDGFRGKKLVYMITERKLKLGIRMDRGVVPLDGTEGEYTTCGLDTLEEDCRRIKGIGAEFTMWRCVFKISETSPSRLTIIENSKTLARFAVVCQKHGLLPVLSIDVLPDGKHNGVEAQAILRYILTGLVKALSEHHVFLEGTLVRVTAAKPGICYDGAKDLTLIAARTAETLNQCLPPALGGVLIAREDTLSRSLVILNEIQNCPFKKPFFVSFCFSRVILNDIISMWAGQDRNRGDARSELMRRLKCCSLATFGQCSGQSKTMFRTVECCF